MRRPYGLNETLRCATLKTQESQWFFARYLLLVVIDISHLIGGATRDHGFLSTAALFTPGQAGGYVGSSPVPTAHQTSLFQPLLVARCSLLVARCSLLVARCSLLVVRCSLFVVDCSLFIDIHTLHLIGGATRDHGITSRRVKPAG